MFLTENNVFCVLGSDPLHLLCRGFLFSDPIFYGSIADPGMEVYMSNKGDVIAFMLITYGSLFCGWGLDVACRKMMGFTKKKIQALYATKEKRELYRSQMKLLRRQKKELQKKNLASILWAVLKG